ncbi:FecR domain-containing protein [Luteolibacter ambystomatis]|uniref:FecR domain-containing protein n=1 Tax=Luteolibacter ambystomatis TaxID=2824561 RepID=A0A975G652_9BACT|nr:FecR family protein [Luteolibacter ambystomatis]QUE49493.1 FecR domain-containing protein [Luteolibacter ambystomatis]
MKTAFLTTTVSLLALATGHADPLKSAKVTVAVNEVKLLPDAQSARPAQVGDTVSGSTSVETGRRSRAELTFADNTVTRLGQNSVFSFRSGGRDMELSQGTILLQVPKTNGGATIRTATVTAAITGTTVMFEYSPNKWIKLVTLEGRQKLFIKGRKDAMEVPAGQMIIMHPNGQILQAPVTVDLARMVGTSALTGKNGNFGPLSPQAEGLIADAIEKQKEQKRTGDLIPTFSVITGPGGRVGDLSILGRSVTGFHPEVSNPDDIVPGPVITGPGGP